ncbi:MAG: transcriptional regulator [Candidatus Nitrosocaldus sp.]
MGITVFLISISLFILYAWLLLASEWSMIIIKYTTLMLVACIVGIFAWLGLSIATTKSKQEQ